MEERLITELVEFVQAASPIVWAAARRQVAVWQVQNIVWAVALWIALFVCVYVKSYANAGSKRCGGDWDALAVVCVFLGVLFLLGLVAVANEIIGATMNPNYYALEALMGLVQ